MIGKLERMIEICERIESLERSIDCVKYSEYYNVFSKQSEREKRIKYFMNRIELLKTGFNYIKTEL